jgi:hypothetical protein
MLKRWIEAVCILLLIFSTQARSQSSSAEVVLTGDVTGAQNKTYFEIPFDVPVGTHRISVDFQYTGKEERTTLDLGVADPERFRGQSGGNKSHFTIGEMDATPSYLPGAIPAGQWRLLIAAPNIRPQSVSHYRALVRFNAPDEDSSFTLRPLASGLRWYRGDLHMHTAHSDGSCPSQSGKNVPCPVFFTAQAAAARGLDFIAITDHNGVSQYNAMRELQPYFDKLLLIPGREMTTFWGHFNIFGVTQFVDYRASAATGLDINAILKDVRAKGGIASINHADSPTGEDCMGCGWTPPTPVDPALLTGVEVVNGGRILLSSADFWDAQLAHGARLAALSGSDNHNALSEPGKPGSIGWVTTAVEADDLSVQSILEGIRRGRTFVDLTASHDKVIDLDATSATAKARMGESLIVAKGAPLQLVAHVSACPWSKVHFFLDGKESTLLPPLAVAGLDEHLRANWTGDGARHWIRAEVRDSNGSLMLISSPIYIDASSH